MSKYICSTQRFDEEEKEFFFFVLENSTFVLKKGNTSLILSLESQLKHNSLPKRTNLPF